jgi:iron complex transport system substrate-binding protein
VPDGGCDGRSGATARAAHQGDEAGARDVRDVAVERPGDGLPGKNTAANEIIALAGAVNAIDGYDGYKIINDEAIIAAKPDVVLSIQRGKDSVDAETVYVHPAFALTPVAANRTFISMEGLYLLGFGPRTAAAARDLSIKLYPALAPQAEKFTPAAVTANCRL